MFNLQSHAPSRSLSALALALAAGLVASAPALALSVPASPTYIEGYAFESGLPTTPDVDLIGGGSLVPIQVGNGPPPAPVVGGGSATSVIGAVGGPAPSEVAGLVAGSSLVGTNDVATSGDFFGFAPTIVGDGQANAGVTTIFGDALSPTTVAANVTWDVTGGSQSLFLSLTERDSIGTVLGTAVAIDLPTQTAIEAGGGFSLELLVDRVAGTAEGILNGDDLDGCVRVDAARRGRRLRRRGAVQLGREPRRGG